LQIQFLGAARTVTGSTHLLTTAHGTRVLLDCDLVQARRRESIERNVSLGLEPATVDAVVLSHHSGALPILVKRGHAGPIYATPPRAGRHRAPVTRRDERAQYSKPLRAEGARAAYLGAHLGYPTNFATPAFGFSREPRDLGLNDHDEVCASV
jgi:glyoxylase-like metal-dependent hydrolase (beta-lactamase superfamily II)